MSGKTPLRKLHAFEGNRRFSTSPDGKTGAGSVRFAVVLPCFNEEGAILETISQIRRSLRDRGSYDFIVVDDGSTDNTPVLLKAAAKQDSELCVITHSRNRGYGASLKTGILQTTADLIVITDADQSYPNERIPELLDLAADADMVVGSRNGPTAQHPMLRRFPKFFLRLYASWIAGEKIPDLNSGLRVFRRDVATQFFYILSDGFSFTTTITLSMLCNDFVVRYEPIDYSCRVGKSKINPIRDTLRFLQLIVRAGLSFAPLRVLLPWLFIVGSMLAFSAGYDAIRVGDLTGRTVALFGFFTNMTLFTLLADAIHTFQKRIAQEARRNLAQTSDESLGFDEGQPTDQRSGKAA